MKTIQEKFAEVVRENLSSLSWKCIGCPQIEDAKGAKAFNVFCEQDDGGEPRYCLPLIEAAVLGSETRP